MRVHSGLLADSHVGIVILQDGFAVAAGKAFAIFMDNTSRADNLNATANTLLRDSSADFCPCELFGVELLL